MVDASKFGKNKIDYDSLDLIKLIMAFIVVGRHIRGKVIL